jgi:hypothetical protein
VAPKSTENHPKSRLGTVVRTVKTAGQSFILRGQIHGSPYTVGSQ